MATLTTAQGAAILGTLRSDTQAALQRAQDVKAKAESGIVHGAFAFLGMDDDNSVDAVPGDLRMQLHELDTYERTLPAATMDPAKGTSWLEGVRYMQKQLKTYAVYQETATVDSLLSQTANATAEEIKDDVSKAGKAVLSFTWKALPWWAWLLAGLAAFFFIVPATLRRKALPT